jgi:preprotein translocase subunit YajC
MNNPITQQLLLIAVPIAIIYFIILRPQQQQKRKHEQSLMSIKKGDEIITNGGLIGDVIHVKALGTDGAPTLDDRITVRSGESRVVVHRARIAHIVPAASTTPAPTPTKTAASPTS